MADTHLSKNRSISDQRMETCRSEFEPILFELIRNGEKRGWKAAEIAMALADAADDVILRLSRETKSKH
ncbi:hypothetical protein ATY81_21240 [Rhizobium sp. R72]|uniref:hypothetical protein n=1 Tax=unclassified Rhizobium TaxID=2613769 RepID=UPI000B6BD5D7|nr:MULTISPECIES: hypothetical protein [unclassified Rhizobium]OWV96979.1 hypothetical protein ATY79_23385 [Rhizobium sp. R693]OWW02604.1 hypothetical protein ATY81_21240 [Rhizobium sp. R72]OWW02754.1 hypothetical protein ATY80_21240 [Rhizobium sp. R711]